ncbi:AmmeMemoRadiSam system protein B [Candidatus Gottesmanbacteria bacterium RIFCSPHIGHO2_02_FULL_39_14]|uniref:AmmeMemoRadiSam system protein B n=1 Tax=Candidatus Gottesmanbacteria bacterium RIFCSPHIGHO2_02_FULL_39_14 TaxID=1798383 RepID=A0A1F5ZXZ0_9BACT|nr:MAG: AmmeMemoRadiSam system protein B [Candidatus Gottesmanbacteria bacterium RIFCSPHIGHO2_02_FULL_39_14]
MNYGSIDPEAIFNSEKMVSAAIVPHYYPAGFMIARLLQTVGGNIERVVVIGPNHREAGGSVITSGSADWETPFGILETDKETVNELYNKGLAAVDEEVLEGEQSIEVLAVYIKYFLKDAKIVPVVLKRAVTDAETEKLADFFSKKIGAETLVLASVDFSHYLTKKEADEKDRQTGEMIKNYRIADLDGLDSDYLDSPGAVITLLKFAQKKKLGQPEVIEHINSADLTGSNPKETTGFYLIVFK